MTTTAKRAATLALAMLALSFAAMFLGSTPAHADGCVPLIPPGGTKPVGCNNPPSAPAPKPSPKPAPVTHTPAPQPAPVTHAPAPKPAPVTHAPAPVKTYSPPQEDYCPRGDYSGQRFDGKCGRAPTQRRSPDFCPGGDYSPTRYDHTCGHAPTKKVVKKAPVKKATPTRVTPAKSNPAPSVSSSTSAAPVPTTPAPTSAPVLQAKPVAAKSTDHTALVALSILGALVLLVLAVGALAHRRRKNA